MSIEIGETLGDAVDRLATPRAGIVFVAFVLFQVYDLVVYRTAIGALIQWIINNFGAQIARAAGLPVPEDGVTVARLQRELVERGLFALANRLDRFTSLGLDFPLWAAIILLLTLPFIAELLHVVAVRAFAAESDEIFPVAAVIDGLPLAYVKSLLANFVAWLLILLGLALFGLPGVILALIFLFVRQRVVLADDGIIGSLKHSYGAVRENLLASLVLLVLVVVITVVIDVFTSILPGPAFIGRIFTAAGVTVTIAIVTSAYLQTESPRGA